MAWIMHTNNHYNENRLIWEKKERLEKKKKRTAFAIFFGECSLHLKSGKTIFDKAWFLNMDFIEH